MNNTVELRLRHNVEFGTNTLDFLDDEIYADATFDPPIHLVSDEEDFDNVVIYTLGIFCMEGATMQAMAEHLMNITPDKVMDRLMT